jgi:hypothetical protein
LSQVHVPPGGHGLVDGGQELAELDGPVPAVQLADDGAVGDVERGEQATHGSTARSGGLRYRPTTSTTLSAKNGSADSLNESCRCGLRSNFFQVCPMVDLLSPVRLAIEARDQCVVSRVQVSRDQVPCPAMTRNVHAANAADRHMLEI